MGVFSWRNADSGRLGCDLSETVSRAWFWGVDGCEGLERPLSPPRCLRGVQCGPLAACPCRSALSCICHRGSWEACPRALTPAPTLWPLRVVPAAP